MTARIESIYRYPVKGLSPEPLAARHAQGRRVLPRRPAVRDRERPVRLRPRRPAASAQDQVPDADAQRAPRDAAHPLRRRDRHARRSSRTAARRRAADLATKEGRLAVEAFFRRFMPNELRGPPKVLAAPRATASRIRAAASSRSSIWRRWRRSKPCSACRCIRCASAPTSMSRAGRPGTSSTCSDREIAIGDVRLKVTKRIVRCAATNVDPDTGIRDLRDPRDADADLRSRGLRHLCAGDRGRRDQAGR